MYGYIYLTTNLINGRQYIGQKHSSKFLGTKYLGSGKILKQAVERYGADNFKVEMLCECKDRDELNEKEIYYIAKYNAQNDPKFYNICKGGTAGPGGPMFRGGHHSEETKAKMRANRKGELNSNYGNRWHCSEETKLLHSKLSSGSNNGMYGKQHSDETKAKIGMKNRLAMLNRVTITDGVKTKHVKQDELNDWLNKGWYKGTSQKFYVSEETRKKRSETGKNLRWVNNGKVHKQIHKDELETYLNNGWISGMKLNR